MIRPLEPKKNYIFDVSTGIYYTEYIQDFKHRLYRYVWSHSSRIDECHTSMHAYTPSICVHLVHGCMYAQNVRTFTVHTYST